jgi:hypothetical protein
MNTVTRPSDAFDDPERLDPCKLCGGVTYTFITAFRTYRRCGSCGELWPLGGPPQPHITIKDLSERDSRTEDAVNELSTILYDEDERIHENQGG